MSIWKRAPEGGSAAPRAAPRKRLRRWLVRGLVLVSSLAALVALGLWALARNANHPAIASLVKRVVRDRTGLSVDYAGLELSLAHGVRLGSLRVLTPAPLQLGEDVETFLRVDGLELATPLWTWLSGEIAIDALRVGALELAVARDASGRTSFDVLFPEAPEPEPAASRSELLERLPRLTVRQLEVGRMRGRVVEQGARGERRTVIGDLSLHGSVRAGGGSVEGTTIVLRGAPLRVELSEERRREHAELGVELSLRGSPDRSLEVELHADLGEHALGGAPAWHGELLHVAGALRFDPDARRTALDVRELRALAKALTAAGGAELADDGTARLSRLRAHVRLEELPPALARLALAALGAPQSEARDGSPGALTVRRLALDVQSTELTWDGARPRGALELSGSLEALELQRGESVISVRGVTLGADGRFDAAHGKLRARLAAPELALKTDVGRARLARATLDVEAARVDGDGDRGEVRAALACDAAEASGPASAVELTTPRLNAAASGRWADLARGNAAEVHAEVGSARLAGRAGASAVRLDTPTLHAALRELVPDGASPLGVRGGAQLSLRAASVGLFDATGLAARRAPRQTLALIDTRVEAALPLSLERIDGRATITRGEQGALELDALALSFELLDPLGWAEPTGRAPRASARGALARFEAPSAHGALSDISAALERTTSGRYGLELGATAAELTVLGAAVPGELRAEGRAHAALDERHVTLDAVVRGSTGAHLALSADARHDAATEQLSYRAELGGERLGALGPLIATAAPGAAPLALSRTRLAASARGELRGVLRSNGAGLPVVIERPLATVRGTQALSLSLSGLEYRARNRALAIPELGFELDSTHGEGGAGQLKASLRAPALRFEGGGSSVALRGLDEQLVATFERAPDAGVVDVRSTLHIDSLAQSWIPSYPVRALRVSAHAELERLRSLFLRELVVDNPAAGTALTARGALEVRAREAPSGKTLVGREALSFDGRIGVDLAPLQALGVAEHATGRLELPFRLESGGLLGYRLLARLEARQVSYASADGSFAVDGLEGAVPILEEFTLLPSGPVFSAGPRTSPLADARFFDVHPFLTETESLTATAITVGGRQRLGPLAANVRLDRSDFLIDQLQAGYRGGQIVGQVRVAYRDGDPIVRLRLNATGLRTAGNAEVFDANTALTFVPKAMILDGKVQVVRASRAHLLDILDVLDPYHESANANRVRRGLTLGYPKSVRFQLHDGAVDTKVELGGLAELVRIDDIKAVPLGPILQKYVAPSFEGWLEPRAAGAAVASAGGAR